MPPEGRHGGPSRRLLISGRDWHPDTPLYFDDDLLFFKALGGKAQGQIFAPLQLAPCKAHGKI